MVLLAAKALAASVLLSILSCCSFQTTAEAYSKSCLSRHSFQTTAEASSKGRRVANPVLIEVVDGQSMACPVPLGICQERNREKSTINNKISVNNITIQDVTPTSIFFVFLPAGSVAGS